MGDQWSKVWSPHGCGVTNDAGKELLGFLSTLQATVCNTRFRKKEIHRVTWQHPKSKQWSCIDYVIMRDCDRRMCSDVTGKRGAECNTDQFLHASVRMAWRVSRREQEWMRARGMICQGWWTARVVVIGSLAGHCSKSTLRKCWRDPHLHGQRKEQWKRDGKWCVPRYWISGWVAWLWEKLTTRLVPGVSADEHRPQLQQKNNAYDRWLASGKKEELTRFKVASNEARKSIREAKNSWFRAKAQEGEGEYFGGKKVWKCIRDMQFGRRGSRVPTRVVAICDESGEPCSTPTKQHQSLRRHFIKVLNVRSQFDGAELTEVRQRITDPDLGTVPTSVEAAKALGKLKNGKAPGSSNILPEMLKAGSKVRSSRESLLILFTESGKKE